MRGRQSSKQPDLRPPKEQRSSGLRGGAYSGPSVKKNRDDIHAVAAYTPGIKGKTQKRRSKWF
jgi:hypothetical protein